MIDDVEEGYFLGWAYDLRCGDRNGMECRLIGVGEEVKLPNMRYIDSLILGLPLNRNIISSYFIYSKLLYINMEICR